MSEDAQYILAIVSLGGFAVQRLLEILDPLLTVPVRWLAARETSTLWKFTEPELKRPFLALIGAFIGTVIACFVKYELPEPLDSPLFFGLAIGGGTEGVNILTKYFNYVKEGRKQTAEPPIEVTIDPNAVPVKASHTFQFKAVIRNADDERLTWAVAHGNGGTFEPGKEGLYRAPATAGTYRVLATSVADPTKYGFALVTVS